LKITKKELIRIISEVTKEVEVDSIVGSGSTEVSGTNIAVATHTDANTGEVEETESFEGPDSSRSADIWVDEKTKELESDGEIVLRDDESVEESMRLSLASIIFENCNFESEEDASMPGDGTLDIHIAPDDLDTMDPEEAYGLGYYSGIDTEEDLFAQDSGHAEHNISDSLSSKFAKEAEAKSAALASASELSNMLNASGTKVDDHTLSRIYIALLRMSRLLQGRTISGKYKEALSDFDIEPPSQVDAWFPGEIVPDEDAWSGGDNLENQLDHSLFTTGESNPGPHTRAIRETKVTITELNKIISEAIDTQMSRARSKGNLPDARPDEKRSSRRAERRFGKQQTRTAFSDDHPPMSGLGPADDHLESITAQDMADAKRYAKSDLPRDQADYLDISVEDWHRIRQELDDHYEDRHMEDQMSFDDHRHPLDDDGDGNVDWDELSENKISLKQLKQIIKEAIDVTNASTGEVMIFADDGDPDAQGYTPDAPELAARDVIKRLGLTPFENMEDADPSDPVEEIYLGAEDWAEMDYEIGGKRHKRKAKKELARLNIDNLMTRLDQWSSDSGPEYAADNPDADMEGVARDLAMGAKYSFATDEWDALVLHFDNSEDDLMSYIADRLVSAHDTDGDGILTISEMKITHGQLRQIIKEAFTTVSDEEFDKITMPGYKGPQPGEYDYLDSIGSQEMADAKRAAGDDPQAQANHLGISVEDWYTIRQELDDHYEDRHREDQMAFDDDWYDLPELSPSIPDDHPSLYQGPGKNTHPTSFDDDPDTNDDGVLDTEEIVDMTNKIKDDLNESSNINDNVYFNRWLKLSGLTSDI